MAFKILKESKSNMPSLEAFDENISFFTKIKNNFNAMKPIFDIGRLKNNSIFLIK